MRVLLSITIFVTGCLALSVGWAQTQEEELKLTALQALVSAPPEKAVPIAARVLRDERSSTILKERALFVLGQMDSDDARTLLLEAATDSTTDTQHEAIRIIGINGDSDSLTQLQALYRNGDSDVRRAVLEAYLIADESGLVYEAALAADTPDDFADAVETLGAMGALDELRALRESAGWSESLIDAYAIAGDIESLSALATDRSDPERQARAIEGLAVAAGDEAEGTLATIYRETSSERVKEAALEGLMIADGDESVLALFHESNDTEEKRRLLEMLVMMDSDAVWDVIDATLTN
ncbi:MAG: HEAT repeat domain-containing protein [Pseudomonadota bacterium]